MKIAYLSSSIIPSRAANSVHVMKMCNAFASNGHDITLYAPNRKNEQEAGVVNVFEFYGVENKFTIKKMPYPKVRFVRNLVYAFSCLFSLFSLKPNLVYGRDFFGCFFAAIFFPTTYEAHAPLTGIRLKLLKLMLHMKKFKKLVLISEALRNVFLQDQAMAKFQKKIFVAHDGADMVSGNIQSSLLNFADEDKIKIGYVGSLYKGKGMEIVAELSKASLEEFSLHVIGGMEKDIAYWQSKIDKENVYFHGFLSQDILIEYMAALDICLLPNQKVVLPYGAKNDSANISDFTSPLKMFEYMSHGKAIVCSDLPVLREVLNEKNSILVKPDSVNEWVGAIRKLADKDVREKLGQQALQDFLSNYTWKIRAKNLAEL